jgi:hypothetical protein
MTHGKTVCSPGASTDCKHPMRPAVTGQAGSSLCVAPVVLPTDVLTLRHGFLRRRESGTAFHPSASSKVRRCQAPQAPLTSLYGVDSGLGRIRHPKNRAYPSPRRDAVPRHSTPDGSLPPTPTLWLCRWAISPVTEICWSGADRQRVPLLPAGLPSIHRNRTSPRAYPPRPEENDLVCRGEA